MSAVKVRWTTKGDAAMVVGKKVVSGGGACLSFADEDEVVGEGGDGAEVCSGGL